MNDESLEEWFEKGQLHFAAQDGNLERVKKLIADGYPLNVFDDIDKTPLHYAAEKEHFDVAEYLIKSGADVNAHNRDRAGDTPLGAIAGNCSYNMAKLLVDAGADPSIPGWMHLTALNKAQERKKEEGKRVFSLLVKVSKQKHSCKEA